MTSAPTEPKINNNKLIETFRYLLIVELQAHGHHEELVGNLVAL